MSNKIMIIHGSPRKNGNTRHLSSRAVQAAQNADAHVTEVDAPALTYRIPGCAGCTKCHQSDTFGCVVDDQLARTITAFTRYDVIVAATPTYWMSYPAQLKMLVDRMGSMIKYTETGEIRSPLAGKELAILATGCGGLENNIDLLEQQWKNIADMMSCRFSSCLFPNTPVETGSFENNDAALKKAEDFGRHLALSR